MIGGTALHSLFLRLGELEKTWASHNHCVGTLKESFVTPRHGSGLGILEGIATILQSHDQSTCLLTPCKGAKKRRAKGYSGERNNCRRKFGGTFG